jgi:AcrR family transcriptional regulator
MPRAGLDTEAVVAAAAELADAEGLDRVSLTALAGRLGVRTPSLYVHIAGADDLRRRLAARGARDLAAATATATSGRAGAEALRALADTYRDYARAHPGTYLAMQRAPENERAEDARAARDLIEVILAALSGYRLIGDAAIHGVRLVRAGLHGFVSLEQLEAFRIPVALDRTYELLVAMLDRALTELGSGCAQSPTARGTPAI